MPPALPLTLPRAVAPDPLTLPLVVPPVVVVVVVSSVPLDIGEGVAGIAGVAGVPVAGSAGTAGVAGIAALGLRCFVVCFAFAAAARSWPVSFVSLDVVDVVVCASAEAPNASKDEARRAEILFMMMFPLSA